MTKRKLIRIVIMVVVLVGAFIGTSLLVGHKPTFTPAKFVTVEAHTYFERGALPSEQFHARVVAYAIRMSNAFDSVTIQYFINESGKEIAVVILTKRYYK